jgi:hypothetical protein
MGRIRGDLPHVPYDCPAIESGNKGIPVPFGGITIPEANFALVMSDYEDMPAARRLAPELYAYFQAERPGGDNSDYDTFANTAYHSPPYGSELHVLAKQVDQDPIVQHLIRAELEERILNCHGVVDGHCWALGGSALEEVIQKVSGSGEEPKQA